MRDRRAFLGLIGGAMAWPLVARAQQPAIPVVGFIRTTSPEDSAPLAAAVRTGLKETGFVEGRNVLIEYRYAQNRYDQLPVLASDLVARRVAVIVATGGTVAARAAKAATTIIPIVFTSGDDAVKAGLVASFNRPGGNVTGISVISGELGGKRLELLREITPSISRIVMLVNPNNPNAEPDIAVVQTAARSVGLQSVVLRASTPSEIDTAFDSLTRTRPGALIVSVDTFFRSRRTQLAALAAHHVIPAVYASREFVTAGGLMSYGIDFVDVYRQAGVYAGRILNGASPADLPVIAPARFELFINLKTAKALGLEIPPTLLARADEVIE
jgi:ABC-type uncharacterized transport system substrate-binding protein